MAMAERQQQHRCEVERHFVFAREARAHRGQWIAMILVLALSGCGLTALAMGYPVVGGVIFGTTIVSLAAVFVIGRVASPRRETTPSSPEDADHTETPPS